MEEYSIRVPLYYVVGRDMSKKELEAAQWVFNLTPCATAVVSRHSDKTIAEPFVYQVLKAEDEAACRDLAAHLARSTNRPMLTIGEGKEMVAVYADGREELICLSNLTSMS